MQTAKLHLLALCAGVLLAVAAPAQAADSGPSFDDSAFGQKKADLTAIRAKIKAKDFQSALEDLKRIGPDEQNADVFNLTGFALRKTGDRAKAQVYYKKALGLNPNHKRALEYQGELYIEIGETDKAKENLAKLVKLCPSGCEERADLEKALAGKAEAAKAN